MIGVGSGHRDGGDVVDLHAAEERAQSHLPAVAFVVAELEPVLAAGLEAADGLLDAAGALMNCHARAVGDRAVVVEGAARFVHASVAAGNGGPLIDGRVAGECGIKIFLEARVLDEGRAHSGERAADEDEGREVA